MSRFGKYIMGKTPFMVAMSELRESSDSETDFSMHKMEFHNQRLQQLNYFHDREDEIKTIIRLYSGKNKKLFRKRVGDFINEGQGRSLKPQDVNASLYRACK